MRSLTFTLDTQTGDDEMAPVTITITEQADGTLLFEVSNEDDYDNLIADLRGLFFDVSDDALIGTLDIAGDDVSSDDLTQDPNGNITDLGFGNNTSGVGASNPDHDGSYEVGIDIGTAGVATDDIQTTTFVLSSSLRGLTLDDIALESFTVRQTSVGDADGSREASDKLFGTAPYPVNAINDAVRLNEDETATGNVFANDIDEDAGDANGDGIPDGLTVTGIDGDAALVGQSIEMADGVTIVINEDGSYSIDATDADYLSVGEVLEATYEYSVNDGNGGSDTATLSVTVNGVNDDPNAVPDTNVTDEASAVSGNVLTNDYDIDRLDSISVSAVNGDSGGVGTQIVLASGALLTLNADGTYDYDPNGAFDSLNTGETAEDSFTYEISDGNGGTASTTATITINGISDDDGGSGDDGEDHFGTFTNKKGVEQAISNVVLYLEGDDGIIKVKIDSWNGGETDLDNVNLSSFLEKEFADYELVAASIKAGNNHNRDLGPGEGQFFLMDGDEDIDYVEGGSVPDGFTIEILSAHADYTFQYSEGLFA
ncbi:MAG: Ig-like domain-containing protein [Pseudomonadota bacterium]